MAMIKARIGGGVAFHAAALLMLLLAGPSLGQPAPAGLEAARALFPDADPGASFTADGGVQTLRPTGAPPVTLRPVRFEPRPERSETRNSYWCGLVLQSGDGPPQAITPIGTGWSEVLSCDRLVEAGPLPPANGVARLGLVYAARSPNAAGRTPAVLRWDAAAARWAIDEALSTDLDDRLNPRTLARMRAMLQQR